jgi:rhodanese-related sulfurtransferase
MSKRYIVLAILLIGIAYGLTQLPDKPTRLGLSPKEFLVQITDPSRFLSTDLIAKRIIEQDPSLFLIDVRSPEEFEEYSIDGAVNIPLDYLLDEDWAGYLNQDAMDIVFYSNSDIYSDQAWALSVQYGYSGLYIMKGGLNEWFRTIMLPTPPNELSPVVDFDLYSFRKGASQYFGGTPSGNQMEVETVKKKQVVVRKKKKKAAEGGC